MDVAYKKDFKHQVSLEAMKAMPELAEMKVLKKGNRLSITPVSEQEFKAICAAGL